MRLDLEGDGTPDEVTANASGLRADFSRGGSSDYPISTSSPYVSLLAVQGDSTASDQELLVITRGAVGDAGDVGQNAVLVDLQDCTLSAVRNAQGEPYVFEIGAQRSGNRTAGIRCTSTGLVGVTGVRGAGGDYTVTRRAVTVRDGQATNGPASREVVRRGTTAAAQLTQVDCPGQPVSLG